MVDINLFDRSFWIILSEGLSSDLEYKLLYSSSVILVIWTISFLAIKSVWLTKNWWREYGDVFSLSNHIGIPCVLPILLPCSSVNKFIVIPEILWWEPSIFLIKSMPAVIFPHWSEPPSCNWTFFSLNSHRKSNDWNTW